MKISKIAVSLLFLIYLSGCAKDETAIIEKLIVGKWDSHIIEDGKELYTGRLEFNKDGTGEGGMEFEWFIKSRKLTIRYSLNQTDFINSVFDILEYSEIKFIISPAEESETTEWLPSTLFHLRKL